MSQLIEHRTSPTQGWKEIQRYSFVPRPYEDVWYWLAGYLRTIGTPLPDGGRPVRLHLSTRP